VNKSAVKSCVTQQLEIFALGSLELADQPPQYAPGAKRSPLARQAMAFFALDWISISSTWPPKMEVALMSAQHATDTQTTMLDWALAYVRAGYNVFLVHTIRNGKCSCGGAKGCKPAKHSLSVASLQGAA
jgi:hypothetical protein